MQGDVYRVDVAVSEEVVHNADTQQARWALHVRRARPTSAQSRPQNDHTAPLP